MGEKIGEYFINNDGVNADIIIDILKNSNLIIIINQGNDMVSLTLGQSRNLINILTETVNSIEEKENGK